MEIDVLVEASKYTHERVNNVTSYIFLSGKFISLLFVSNSGNNPVFCKFMQCRFSSICLPQINLLKYIFKHVFGFLGRVTVHYEDIQKTPTWNDKARRDACLVLHAHIPHTFSSTKLNDNAWKFVCFSDNKFLIFNFSCFLSLSSSIFNVLHDAAEFILPKPRWIIWATNLKSSPAMVHQENST